MMCVVDAHGVFEYANRAWTRALGWQPSELVGHAYLDFVHPDDLESTMAMATAHAEGKDVSGFVNRYRTKDGYYRDIQWWSEDGEHGRLFASAQDVTETHRSNSRATEIEEVSGVCSWEVDIETNAVYWSPGMKRMIGWDKDRSPTFEEAVGFFAPESVEVLMPAFEKLLEAAEPYAFEMTHLRTDGSKVLVWATGAAEVRNGKVVRAYGTCQDISERRQQEKEVLARERDLREAAEKAFEAERKALLDQAWTARHDTLTGLGNRQLLEEEMASKSRDVRFVFAIDLDRFKHVNDSFGHHAGDFVLKQTAERLKRAASRSTDKIFRVGGDEFVMLVNEAALDPDPTEFCNWLVDQLCETMEYEGTTLAIGASVGFAVSSGEVSLPSAMRHADMALYEAKAKGRKRALAYTDSLGSAHFEKIALANDLKIACQNEDIEIALQPQVAAATGALTGCEVLARWTHPTRGIISPDVFLPLAEEFNVLSVLDKIVLDKALAARFDLSRMGFSLPKLSVNVSAKRLTSSGLLEEIASREDVPGNGLSFEILETAFLDTIEGDFLKQVEGLRALGIRIEVDDFGTGHASFASVLALKPDVIKFDRMFVPGINTDGGKRELMEGLIKIARNVGALNLVEGVETEAEAQTLIELGVDQLQGYAFGRPMRVEELCDWMRDGATGLVA